MWKVFFMFSPWLSASAWVLYSLAWKLYSLAWVQVKKASHTRHFSRFLFRFSPLRGHRQKKFPTLDIFYAFFFAFLLRVGVGKKSFPHQKHFKKLVGIDKKTIFLQRKSVFLSLVSYNFTLYTQITSFFALSMSSGVDFSAIHPHS